MKKYWLHRISHNSHVSYPLLDNGYLSIGFSEYFSNHNYLNRIMNSTGKSDVLELLSLDEEHFYGKPRQKYSLTRFLYEFKEGDTILVPKPKTFSLFEITGKPIIAGDLPVEILTNDKYITSDGSDILYDTEKVDIGFLIPVKRLQERIPREKYSNASLISKMKFRGMNVDITDLADDVEEAQKRFVEDAPISIYSSVIENFKIQLLEELNDKMSPDDFEKLVKWYMNRIGANSTYIPTKNSQGTSEEGDADVVAIFENVKVIISIQVKKHHGDTGELGVDQIILHSKNIMIDDDYNHIIWVITSGDDFNEEAITKAKNNNVRLINGIEFTEMLINVGIENIDEAFSTI